MSGSILGRFFHAFIMETDTKSGGKAAQGVIGQGGYDGPRLSKEAGVPQSVAYRVVRRSQCTYYY